MRHNLLELGAPGAGPETLLPVVLTVDDTDSPGDAIDTLALAAFVAGKQPYAATRELDNVREDATLAPPAARVLREATSDAEQARRRCPRPRQDHRRPRLPGLCALQFQPVGR